MKHLIKTTQVKDICILYAPGSDYDGKFAATVNNRRYIGYFCQIGNIKAVTELYNGLCDKQTTLRIKTATEIKLNELK